MLFSVSAFAISLNECNKMSAALNSRTPMKIDSMTTVKSSYCSDSKPKPTLVYMMETSLGSLDINAMQNIQKNEDCFFVKNIIKTLKHKYLKSFLAFCLNKTLPFFH